jgi:pimeloyl-[acyl-carrier protein] methyl ester esterase
MAKPLLVLLHGWAMHHQVWGAFAGQLTADFEVLALDLPGYGACVDAGPMALTAMVEQIAQVISQPHFYVLGWSLGGLVALELTQRYPHRVMGVALLASNPCFVATATWPGMPSALLVGFLERLTRNPQQTVQHFLRLQVQQSVMATQQLQALKVALALYPLPQLPVLVAGLQLLADSDLREVLSALTCPVVVLLGACDGLVPQALAAHLPLLNDSIQLQVIEGAGHAPFLSHPQLLVSVLREAWL